MNITKTIFATAAAACFSMSASAMQPLAEEQLSDVTGQAVSILGNLNVNIGSVTYTDNGTTANGGSFTASNINATGLVAATLDLLTEANFTADLVALTGLTAAQVEATVGAGGFYTYTAGIDSDVVKIAVPNLGIGNGSVYLPDVSIGSMTMGNSTKSFGSLAVNAINLQGTTVYIWAH